MRSCNIAYRNKACDIVQLTLFVSAQLIKSRQLSGSTPRLNRSAASTKNSPLAKSWSNLSPNKATRESNLSRGSRFTHRVEGVLI